VRAPRLTSFAAGAVVALLLGSGTAVAATGGKFILGHKNSAGAVSTLTNTRGPALSLRSRSGTPSLVVNSRSKVTNLNADSLDGLDATALALAAGRTGVVKGLASDLGSGAFVASASCPSGTLLTGGGVWDNTSSGITYLNAPDEDRPTTTWMAAVSVDTSVVPADAPEDVKAYAVCYNPRGAVRVPSTSVLRLSPVMRQQLVAKAAAVR
jgi:hypothetical protein